MPGLWNRREKHEAAEPRGDNRMCHNSDFTESIPKVLALFEKRYGHQLTLNLLQSACIKRIETECVSCKAGKEKTVKERKGGGIFESV